MEGSPEGYDTTAVLGFGSLFSVSLFFVVLAYYVMHPLCGRGEGSFLLAAHGTGQIFSAVCLYQWFTNDLDPTRPCPNVVWLREVGLVGSSFYYLALSLHLRHSTCNPFGNVGLKRFHVGAILCMVGFGAFDVTSKSQLIMGHRGSRAVESGSESLCPDLLLRGGTTIVMPLLFVIYTIAIIIVGRAKLHITKMEHSDGLFTERRRVIAKALLDILWTEAIYIFIVMFIFVPHRYSTVEPLRWVASNIFVGCLALQDAVGSLVWMVVYCKAWGRFQQAVNNDHTSSHLKPDDVNIPELSFHLRRTIVQLIARGNEESVRKSIAWASDYSAADVTSSFHPKAVTEYRRTLPIVVQKKTREKWSVEVHSHAPRVFHELRELFHIDPEDFIKSMNMETHECFTEGKSGAFLYFTRDKRFIIKTATPSEFKFLLSVLPKYYHHVKNNPNTLINRILGAYHLRLYGQRVQVVVVESIFQTQRPIDERFDLKGSTVRSASRGDKLAQESWLWKRTSMKVPGVLTDVSMRGPLLLEEQDAKDLARTLRDDVSFLADEKIMDYSLLLGVSNTAFKVDTAASGANRMDRGPDGTFARQRDLHGQKQQQAPAPQRPGEEDPTPFFRRQDGGLRAAFVEGPEIYFVGIVDILQEFNFRKKVEHLVRRFLLCGGRGVSCRPPDAYAQRFVDNVVIPLIEENPLLQKSPRSRSDSVARPSRGYLRDVGIEMKGPLVENLIEREKVATPPTSRATTPPPRCPP